VKSPSEFALLWVKTAFRGQTPDCAFFARRAKLTV
jgi:hypothetical protein